MTEISRDELLRGLPARRASMLLFAIQNRTAHLVARSRQATALVLTEQTLEARERAFLSALAQGRDVSVQATIQDLERYAPRWADLVPPDPLVRAALLHLLGESFPLPAAAVPSLRLAVGADDPAVRAVYERLYGTELTTIYAARLPLGERVRWMRARAAHRLETLPPFWTAFALTLTGTVGTTTLALPIAVATVGPAVGIGLLLGVAAVTILTIAAMSEAVTRNGAMRYGSSYLGRLVADLLGSTAASLFTLAALFAIVFALLVRFIGFASILDSAVPVPAAAWAALLFLVNLRFLRRGTFDSTLASTLVVGAVNVALIVLLSLLALPHVSASRLSHSDVPGVGGGSLDSSALGLVLGVVLGVYARHISVGSAAKLVLPRDPSGRSLLSGGVAGLAGAAVLSCLWVFAMNGALAPARLAGERGTALPYLADLGGPIVDAAGGLFAVLAMGMGSVAMSLALFYHVREWLPAESGRRTRFATGLAPIVALFVLVEWLLVTDRASFTGAIAFVNAITGPVLSGIFPVLLLAASRRKGEYVPGTMWRFVNRAVVAGTLYVFFVAVVFLYGFVLWDDPVQRAVAVVAGVVTLGATILFAVRGSYRAQAVVELRADGDESRPVVFNVTAAGRPAPADVRLDARPETHIVAASSGELPALARLRSVTFRLSPSEVRAVKVWLHRLTADGRSEGLAGRVTVGGREVGVIDTRSGQLVVPLDRRGESVEITVSSFTPPDPASSEE
jgi:amino acid permease